MPQTRRLAAPPTAPVASGAGGEHSHCGRGRARISQANPIPLQLTRLQVVTTVGWAEAARDWVCFAQRKGTGNRQLGTGPDRPFGRSVFPVPRSPFPIPCSRRSALALFRSAGKPGNGVPVPRYSGPPVRPPRTRGPGLPEGKPGPRYRANSVSSRAARRRAVVRADTGRMPVLRPAEAVLTPLTRRADRSAVAP